MVQTAELLPRLGMDVCMVQGPARGSALRQGNCEPTERVARTALRCSSTKVILARMQAAGGVPRPGWVLQLAWAPPTTQHQDNLHAVVAYESCASGGRERENNRKQYKPST